MPYARETTSVVCNETGVHLVLPPLRRGQQQITLRPDTGGDDHFVDLEEYARPTEIQYAGLDKLERRGKISFHAKGAKPRGKAQVKPGAGVMAPTQSDKRLNEVIAKEEREELRTRQSSRRREEP